MENLETMAVQMQAFPGSGWEPWLVQLLRKETGLRRVVRWKSTSQ